MPVVLPDRFVDPSLLAVSPDAVSSAAEYRNGPSADDSLSDVFNDLLLACQRRV
jgi:hypothetical protein